VTPLVVHPLQVVPDVAVALIETVAIVLGVALVTGGATGAITLFVVKGLTGHRLYESTGDSAKTGGVLGIGIVTLYVLTLAILEFVATGRLEFLVVLVLVALAGVVYVARPLSEDPDHVTGRFTLAAVAVLVFAVAYLVALLFAYPLVSDAVESLGSLL